jgi:predicted O-methyltransferase YrrM
MELSDLASEPDIHEPKLDHPVFDRMDNVERQGALYAASRLMACARLGYEVLKARRIIDFGAGNGVSALPLGLLANRSGGSVDSLEICSTLQWAEKIKHLGIEEHLPVRVHGVDGLEWISSKAQEGKRYDLITGCWFAPDNVADRTRGLLAASRQALDSNGLLIVYSDHPTMQTVRSTLGDEKVLFDGYDSLDDPSTTHDVDMVVLQQPF